MKKFQHLIAGIVIGVVLTGTAVFATTFTANHATFPVYVNGARFTPHYGHILEVEGRTYLPVRDVSNALGIAINWNDAAHRVEIGTPPAAPATPAPAQTLVGTWLWNNQPYYVFNAGGTGTMAGSAIRWWTGNGVLSICNTPAMCGNNCPAPMDWRYSFSGNQLTLTSTTIANMSFTYTRQ